MTRNSLLVVLALAAPLGACAQSDLLADEGQPAPGSGEAQSHNLAAQAVNPGAPAADGSISMDGTRAALAQSRYQQNKVVPPTDVQIGNMGTSGGASGSTGGGGGQ